MQVERKHLIFLLISAVFSFRYPGLYGETDPSDQTFMINPLKPVIMYQIIQLIFVLLLSAQDMMVNRTNESNLIMRTMGLKDLPNTLGNMIVDFILLLPVTAAFAVECIFYQFPEDALILNLARIMLTPIGVIIYSYNCSRLSSSNNYLILWTVLLTFINTYLNLGFLNFYNMFDVNWTIANLLGSLLFLIVLVVLFYAVGFFPGALIGSKLYLVLFSCIFQFILLQYKEIWKRAFNRWRSKSKPRKGNLASNSGDLNCFITEEKARLFAENNDDMVKIIEGNKYNSKKKEILSNINFGVEKGQIFCLLGPNRSGKTLIFDLLIRRCVLDSGIVCIKGQEVKNNHPSTAVTGACLQSDTHWDTLTVKQNLTVMGYIRGMTNEEAEEAAEQMMHALDLHRYSSEKPSSLSDGTKRKLNVAMALIGGPELVLLDTPTTGVDPVGRSQIWTLLKKLVKAKGSTVLLSTHYTEDAELVADKLGIIVNGRIVNIGTISDLRKSFIEHYIVIDEVEEGFMEMLVSIVRGVIPEAEVLFQSKGITFKVPSTAMKFGKIVEELENLSRDKKITDFSINVKTLEETFMEYASHQNQAT